MGEFERIMAKQLIGKRIRIIRMKGESHYDGREGTVEFVDDAGQLHGTWGGCAVIPGEDEYAVLAER